jgi:hypothetical protein
MFLALITVINNRLEQNEMQTGGSLDGVIRYENGGISFNEIVSGLV